MRERALVRNGRRDISSYYTPAVFRRLILICSLFLSLSLSTTFFIFQEKRIYNPIYIFFPSFWGKQIFTRWSSPPSRRQHLSCSWWHGPFFFSPPPSLEEFEKQLCYKNESIYSRCWIIIALARHNLHIMVPNKASWHKHPLLEKEEKKRVLLL